MQSTTSTLAPEAARHAAPTARPALHPLAADAARLMVGHERELAAVTARRDALPETDPMRPVHTHRIGQLSGWLAQLAPYLPDGWSAAAVLAATCTNCAAGFGQAHGRGCRERYGELDD